MCVNVEVWWVWVGVGGRACIIVHTEVWEWVGSVHVYLTCSVACVTV